MFRKAQIIEPILDSEITRLLDDMHACDPDSPKYKPMLESLERLYHIRQGSKTRKVSSDTILIVMGNLLGILIIVAYERGNVLTSKGLGFVMKPK